MKQIFGDICLIYRNFGHWVIATIFYPVAVVIIAAIPMFVFFVVFYYIIYLLNIDVGNIYYIMGSFLLIIFYTLFLYVNVFLIDVCMQLKTGEKLKFEKNIGFKFSSFRKFFIIIYTQLLFTLIAIACVSFLGLFLVYVFTGTDVWGFHIENDSLIYYYIIGLCDFFVMVYILLRTSVSYPMAIEDLKNNTYKSGGYYLKNAWIKTRKKFNPYYFIFLLLVFIYFVIIFSIVYFFQLEDEDRSIIKLINMIGYVCITSLGNMIITTLYFNIKEKSIEKQSIEQ